MNDPETSEILLIEDNPHDAELVIRALKKRNLANHIHHVEDGVDALDFLFTRGKYAEQTPSENLKVILLDIKLPRIDGLEVLKAIKTDKRTRSIPVVVMTSSAEELDIFQAYKLGANSFITKPVEFDAFIETISGVGAYWLMVNHPPQGGW